MNYIEKVKTFVKNEKYAQREDFLGLIIYGSSKYGTATSDSDIDLLALTYHNKNFKGVRTIEGTKLEFFEKSFYYILNQIENIAESQDNTLLSIFQNGEFIYGDKLTYEYIKEQLNFARKIPKQQKSSQISNYLSKVKTTEDLAYKNFFLL